jgi:DNA-binding response OmpR family regulator
MRVLLVEDDRANAEVIVNAFTSDGHSCDVIFSGEEFDLSLVKGNVYDLVILDIYLSGVIDGYEIMLRIRGAKFDVPIMILSAIGTVVSKIRGFNFGADDYLTKPFHKAELLGRAKAIVRRAKGHPESVITVGNMSINFDTRNVTVRGQNIHLTHKEYTILEFLAMRKGTVLTKEMFLNHLYTGPDEPSDNKIIDVFMCKLRKKLMAANGGVCYIETVWGRGYVLKEVPDEIDDGYISESDSESESDSGDYDSIGGKKSSRIDKEEVVG